MFHSLLEKAKKSMDDAVKVMKGRDELGPDRLYFEKGEKLPANELKEEVDSHDETVRHQKQAIKRLTILLDSIKEEIAQKDEDKKNRDQAKNEEPKKNAEDEPPPPKTRPGDGLPPAAELKAFAAMQLDLNERTAAFAETEPRSDQAGQGATETADGVVRRAVGHPGFVQSVVCAAGTGWKK